MRPPASKVVVQIAPEYLYFLLNPARKQEPVGHQQVVAPIEVRLPCAIVERRNFAWAAGRHGFHEHLTNMRRLNPSKSKQNSRLSAPIIPAFSDPRA
jgi:hypothetical protein